MQEVLLLGALVIKHAIADLFIQSYRKPANKTRWFDPGLQWHALDHSILIFVVLLLLGPVPLSCAVALAILDHVLHVSIDWIKTNTVNCLGIKRDGSVFWRIQAVDQIAHYLTYILIVLLAMKYAV